MRNTVQLCFAANNILLMLLRENGRLLQGSGRFPLPENNYEKQTRWSNDKTFIKLDYRIKSAF